MADPQPSPRVTYELCRDTKQRLVFEPKTEGEAEFVAEQLLSMGFAYYKTDYANLLKLAVQGSIYLDVDKTIMITASKPSDNFKICPVDSFSHFYLPEGALMENPRLSAEDCQRRTLAFYPRSKAEARGILGALVAVGVQPPEGDRNPAAMIAQAVVYGVFVRGGRLGFAPSAQDLIGAEICTARDIGLRSEIALSPEQATVMAAFNEMGARLSQLSQRVANLEDAVLPKELSKKALPPPRR